MPKQTLGVPVLAPASAAIADPLSDADGALIVLEWMIVAVLAE